MERNINYYLNSPLVIIVPYLILVLVFGINMIFCDLKKNNTLYSQKQQNIVITRTKMTDTPIKVPSNSINYQTKIIKKRFVC